MRTNPTSSDLSRYRFCFFSHNHKSEGKQCRLQWATRIMCFLLSHPWYMPSVLFLSLHMTILALCLCSVWEQGEQRQFHPRPSLLPGGERHPFTEAPWTLLSSVFFRIHSTFLLIFSQHLTVHKSRQLSLLSNYHEPGTPITTSHSLTHSFVLYFFSHYFSNAFNGKIVKLGLTVSTVSQDPEDLHF